MAGKKRVIIRNKGGRIISHARPLDPDPLHVANDRARRDSSPTGRCNPILRMFVDAR